MSDFSFSLPSVTREVTKAQDPGGEVLPPSNWLIDTRPYSDWSIGYEAGKFERPIRLPPEINREISIGRKLKFTDLIGLANVDGMGWDRMGSDGMGPPFEALRTSHYTQPQLRVITFVRDLIWREFEISSVAN